jgi:hypothetical protein
MARFKIVGSRQTDHPNQTDFDVVYLEGTLTTGEEFVVYDTHHPIRCKIIKSSASGNVTTLRCNMKRGIGWENQYEGAIVDTQAKSRPAAFRYHHDEK